MKNDIISIYLRYLKQLFKQYPLTQWVASIITLFLCIGITIKLPEYIPDLIGHPPDSFIGKVVILLCLFFSIGGIIMIMKPFLGKKSDHSGGGNHHDAGVGGDGGGGGGDGGGGGGCGGGD